MSFADIPIRLLILKKSTNIEKHLLWLEYLAGPQFVEDWKRSIQTGGHMQKLINSARQIVEEHIYAFNVTPGTGSIKKSFTGKYLESSAVSDFAVYSDKSIAPSKIPEGKWSYAAFFEDPKFNTFLPPRDNPYSPIRHRPFFGAMTMAQKKLSLELAHAALLKTIKKRMPRL